MTTAKKSFALLTLSALLCLTACDEGEITPVVKDDAAATVTTEHEDSDARTTTASQSDLAALPKDTGGTHTPYLLGSTAAKYGYYLYTPGGYQSNTKLYPLLVFLHGKGERGDGSNSISVLNKVLVNGPPKLIKDKQWNPKYPMMVVSPQYHGTGGNVNNWGAGDPQNLKTFIEYMISHYRIDPKRIYLTGLSHGGNGVYDYLTKLSDDVNHIAAAVPMAAYGAQGGFANSKNTPVWSFVGELDVTDYNTTKTFTTKYNAQVPAPLFKAKISVYLGVGHDVWTRTYNSTGMGKVAPLFDPFSENIYDWMFRYKRTAP